MFPCSTFKIIVWTKSYLKWFYPKGLCGTWAERGTETRHLRTCVKSHPLDCCRKILHFHIKCINDINVNASCRRYNAYLHKHSCLYHNTINNSSLGFAGVQGGGGLKAPPYFFLIFILQVSPPWADPKPLEGRRSAASHTGPSGAGSQWLDVTCQFVAKQLMKEPMMVKHEQAADANQLLRRSFIALPELMLSSIYVTQNYAASNRC